MLYYGVTQLMIYLQWHGGGDLDAMVEALSSNSGGDWANLGGQLMPVREVDRLREDICSGRLKSWPEVHERYEALWKVYPLAKQQHAYRTLCDCLGLEGLDKTHWNYALDQALVIQENICERVLAGQKENLENPFAQALFGSSQEMEAVLGAAKNDAFIQEVCDQTKLFATQVQRFKAQK